MILDAHAHIGPAFRTRPVFSPGVDPADIVRLMDEAGISRACLFPPAWEGPEFRDPRFEQANRAVAAARAAYPDRFITYARVNPNFKPAALVELERCRTEYGCRGLKLHPLTEYFWVSNLGLLRPLFERCDAWRWPVFFHSGYYPTCQPALFIPLARAFPRVPIILAHLSYAHTGDAIIAAQTCANIYLETSANTTTAAIAETLRRVGPEQLVFGSDMPFTHPLDVIRKIEAVPGLTSRERDLILGQNMARLLGEDLA